IVVIGFRGSEDAVDDHREDRHFRAAHRIGESNVDRGMLHGREAAVEHGLRERPDEIPAAGCNLCRPVLIRDASRTVTLIQGIQASRERWAQYNGAAADGTSDGSMLAFWVSRDVDAAPERERPRVETLRER